MVIVCVLGLGRLGGNIAGDLAFHGHTVRGWDVRPEALDKVHERLTYEKKKLKEDGLMVRPDFLGDVYLFTNFENAVQNAELVVECVEEDLPAKITLFEKVSKICRPDAILATTTLRLSIDEIVANVDLKERCIGMRFLFPVFCIPETELTTSKFTNLATIEYCLKFLERCGKTGFFRSGLEPLILDEAQRLQRRKKRIEEFSKNRDLSGRGIFLVPHLAHSGNFAPPQDDATNRHHSALDSECVICMDRPRGCILRPCHHLCTCSNCGLMLIQRKDSCPICRTKLSEIIPFYSS